MIVNIIQNIYFFIFSGIAIISSLIVIFAPNPVHSVLALILVFFNSALLVLLLDLEFFAVIFVIIYIGAIMVLFTFIIMMLDIKKVSFYVNLRYYFLISGFVLINLALVILVLVNYDLVSLNTESGFIGYINWFQLINETSSIFAIGSVLYTFFYFFLMLAGLVLLVAMIGAIVLTIVEGDSISNKRQLLHKQVNVSPTKAVFLVKDTN